ncbi:MAG: hypothetical protein ACRD3Q_06010, partial [Terriglobales bacterium]
MTQNTGTLCTDPSANIRGGHQYGELESSVAVKIVGTDGTAGRQRSRRVHLGSMMHDKTRLMLFPVGVALWLGHIPLGLAQLPLPESPQRVAVVACPENDEVRPAMLLAGESMSAPVQQAVAAQMDYYQAGLSPGVYAPKGWSCRAWDGSNGTILLVTPRRLDPPFYPLPTVTGAAVMIET